jgi:murein DD-endopeptidase MepM/ murein hydrolase activator NlpD
MQYPRFAAALPLMMLAAACTAPLDIDMRGPIGGFSTTDAARNAPTTRPEPDARGVITYPNYQVVVAQSGETITEIASRLGLDAGALARFNGRSAETGLRAGEVIALPTRVAAAPVDIEAMASAAIEAAPDTPGARVTPAPAPVAAAPVGPEPVRHQVQRGETAFTIARLYDVPVTTIADWNGLGPEFTVREGQQLLIPVTQRAQASAETGVSTTEPGQGSPTPTPPSATQPLPENDVEPGGPLAPSTAGAAGQTTAVSQTAAMTAPVQGRVIRDYRKGRNEGIDIAGTPGDPIVAAADGTVAAITADADQVPIIVLRHPNELLTVYANVDAITVNRGERVTRGQKLGQLRAGEEAYVHFEVRQGFESVDPTPYLR